MDFKRPFLDALIRVDQIEVDEALSFGGRRKVVRLLEVALSVHKGEAVVGLDLEVVSLGKDSTT